jgi:hypothetical protein
MPNREDIYLKPPRKTVVYSQKTIQKQFSSGVFIVKATIQVENVAIE